MKYIVDNSYPILPYTKSIVNGFMTYIVYGDQSHTSYNHALNYDPVFLNIGNFKMMVSGGSDANIFETCKKYNLTPILKLEHMDEKLPIGLEDPVVPASPIIHLPSNYTEMIDRICPSCGEYYNDINRCDLISGKHLICDKCKVNPNIIVNPVVRNVCGNCGLIYDSITHEDFCSYYCQIKFNENIRFVLLKFDGIIKSYRDLEIVKEYDSIKLDEPIDIPIDIPGDIPGDKPRVKMTSIIHRVCPDCSTVYETTRAMLKKNRGVLCKDHAKKHRVTPRVSNTCGNCGITFDSIVKEDYCSEECKNFNNSS